MELVSVRFHLTTQNSIQFETYELFISGIFHLIFSEWGWPRVTEIPETGDGGLLYTYYQTHIERIKWKLQSTPSLTNSSLVHNQVFGREGRSPPRTWVPRTGGSPACLVHCGDEHLLTEDSASRLAIPLFVVSSSTITYVGFVTPSALRHDSEFTRMNNDPPKRVLTLKMKGKVI